MNDRVLAFLQTRGHGGATIKEIQTHTGMAYRTTYLLMRRLLKLGKIRGDRYKAIWVFCALEPIDRFALLAAAAEGALEGNAAYQESRKKAK